MSKFSNPESSDSSNNGLDHAQFRQYSSPLGRWMSPDPYNGSMDLSNPQSLNRYAYVGNRPLVLVDPSGLDGEGGPSIGGAIGGCFGAVATEGANIGADISCGITIFEDILSLFGHHHPLTIPRQRSNRQPWDEKEFPIHYGPNIAGALGLPSQACEFGACGSSFTDYNRSQTSAQLYQAYLEATVGLVLGLKNIAYNSTHKYDFGWGDHANDTWDVCGQKLNADQFGNFIAGFEGAVYDRKYFLLAQGLRPATLSVAGAGVVYHLFGATKATSDRVDATGLPDIRRGAQFGWNYFGGVRCQIRQ